METIWEYDVELLKGTTHQVRAVLDKFGRDGWELVSIIGSMAYFKKPREIQATIPAAQPEWTKSKPNGRARA